MQTFPAMDRSVCHSPHLVILGAGASKAAFLRGDTIGRPVPLMNEIVETVGLGPLLREWGIAIDTVDFESLYSDLLSSLHYEELVRSIQERIRDYFVGLQLAKVATIYDYLLLCLRPKDVIATFNWDPFLAQAYERWDIGLLPMTLHLHGGVRIGVCLEHRFEAFLWQQCRTCGKPLTPTKLFFPVKQKNYTDDPYIASQWEQLQYYINQAYRITIFGYSAPVTDVEARERMLNVWRTNQIRDFSQIEIIDLKSEGELRETWSDFIVKEHFSFLKNVFDAYMFRHPRRSCEAFAGATLRQSPWKENILPALKTLRQLREWISPLIAEERRYNEEGIPFDADLVITS